MMTKQERSTKKRLLYVTIAVIIPLAGILINHLFRPDHILISLFLIVWIGFFIMALEPFEIKGEEKTVEP